MNRMLYQAPNKQPLAAVEARKVLVVALQVNAVAHLVLGMTQARASLRIRLKLSRGPKRPFAIVVAQMVCAAVPLENGKSSNIECLLIRIDSACSGCASCGKSSSEAVTEVKEAAQASGQHLPEKTFKATA